MDRQRPCLISAWAFLSLARLQPPSFAAAQDVSRVEALPSAAGARAATSQDLQTVGYEIKPRPSTSPTPAKFARPDPTLTSAEVAFLDTSLCFASDAELFFVDLEVFDPKPLQERRFHWRVLKPMPSLSQVAAQWFQIGPALDPAPKTSDASKLFPGPGAYRLHFEPPMRMHQSQCLGWSMKGLGQGPIAYEECPDCGNFTWAISTGGLHDVVELIAKRGYDHLTSRERSENHLEWAGRLQRTTSLKLHYRPIPKQAAEAPKERSNLPVVSGGNPSCWRSGFSFDDCCVGGPDGGPNDSCWDSFFTFERCCTLETVRKFQNLDFAAAANAFGHYNLQHLDRHNLPRLGPVQDDEALLLFALARVMRPRTIVEFGTSNGFSAMNWLHAIADDPEARIFSYDIMPYPSARDLEDSDTRFVFLQKSQADFEPSDIEHRAVEIAFFDAGHLLEYSLKAFERILPSLSPNALVAVHDTGLHVNDHRIETAELDKGKPFTKETCTNERECRNFPNCPGDSNAFGACVGWAHRASERLFIRELVRLWPEFKPIHLHSRRVFRHGLTILQRGTLWDPDHDPDGPF